MSCPPGTDLIQCDTVQILEPQEDLLVDSAGTTNDLDERGELALNVGQATAVIIFEVPKLNANYHFEYLYVDAMGVTNPGGIQVVPTVRAAEGFACVFVGLPIGPNYVLHWRVVITRTAVLDAIDSPESLSLVMPRTTTMTVLFHNPRSGISYGFTELRVENLVDDPSVQAVIRVQVYRKLITGFSVAVNPRPPTDSYVLKVRTP